MFGLGPKKPDVEINKPDRNAFWQRPGNGVWIVWLAPAEKIVFGSTSSGAHNGIERASEIARGMVTRLGMNERLGPLTYGRRRELAFLGVAGEEERNYSETTVRMIDSPVRLRRAMKPGRRADEPGRGA